MLICPNVGQTVIKKNAAISNVEFVQTDRSYSYIVLALVLRYINIAAIFFSFSTFFVQIDQSFEPK